MSIQPSTSPKVGDVYIQIKDTKVDHKVFLTCLGFTKQQINEFNCNNFGNQERAFLDGLDKFLQTCDEGSEWEKIHDILKRCGDVETARKIRPFVTNQPAVRNPPQATHAISSGIDEYGYTYVRLLDPANLERPDGEDRSERVQILKGEINTKYNLGEKVIRDHCSEVKKAVDDEYQSGEKAVSTYTERTETFISEHEERIGKLTNKIKICLEQLDSKGLDLASISKIEEKVNGLEKELERIMNYDSKAISIPDISTSLSTEKVLECLESTIVITTHNSKA